jgi:YfiH family protein
MWTAIEVGKESVLVGRRQGAVMAFSAGPPMGAFDQVNRLRALAEAFPIPLQSLSFCRQTHGSVVHRVDARDEGVVRVGEGDGLVSTRKGCGLVVWTADCVPALLAGDGVVAAVHSGWRGCAADVLGAAVAAIGDFGGVPPAGLQMSLGPAVCGDCYRVGQEVRAALDAFDLDPRRWWHDDRVDLRGFLAARGEALGIPAERIELVGGCTAESSELASYRRDGSAAGRQWAMALLEL